MDTNQIHPKYKNEGTDQANHQLKSQEIGSDKKDFAMDIKVKMLNGRKIKIKVWTSWNVSAIRQKLEKLKVADANGNYNLISRGLILEQDRTILSYIHHLRDNRDILCVTKIDF